MRSKWFELKDTALHLRREGLSIKTIEQTLHIPRSTLSGWFSGVELSEKHKQQLQKNKEDGWAKARVKAAEWHHTQKALRLLHAKREAAKTLEDINISDALLDLALAMLYLGEGKKTQSTSLSSSDPLVLKFTLAVLRRNYALNMDTVSCDLHLRAGQDPIALKKYWSSALHIPIERFKSVSIDKRTSDRPTYAHYKGVCVLKCGRIAIQRKLIYLYNLFCEQVAALDEGV
jgi:hypothetical protein